ncbi:hypothetical protein MGG_04728 [Pyricularia oryzae 70-15]|uniref:Uncharacterized protein n=3 Tax=Pyricularia oryzae TaxID=318829 RepID=G4MTQ1_PYRO7|nr:uncharacterized protein MGG_04728 [Pyricularia oryzae 70-15]EHA53890.1 hypothetical protein MGG_04728 [Pyricularia oryzae 70-15]ELQ42765.1 hypothetical protein OOU_Y34scaffold00194g78 [Pyricularia oryzae Y34]
MISSTFSMYNGQCGEAAATARFAAAYESTCTPILLSSRHWGVHRQKVVDHCDTRATHQVSDPRCLNQSRTKIGGRLSKRTWAGKRFCGNLRSMTPAVLVLPLPRDNKPLARMWKDKQEQDLRCSRLWTAENVLTSPVVVE